jgi:hypothetical protein
MKMTFQEIRIIATGPCIANQLDVKVFLTFTSLSLVLLLQLFYLFCSSIVANTVIVTAGDFEP